MTCGGVTFRGGDYLVDIGRVFVFLFHQILNLLHQVANLLCDPSCCLPLHPAGRHIHRQTDTQIDRQTGAQTELFFCMAHCNYHNSKTSNRNEAGDRERVPRDPEALLTILLKSITIIIIIVLLLLPELLGHDFCWRPRVLNRRQR